MSLQTKFYVAPATLTNDSLVLVWDYPEVEEPIQNYEVFQNQQLIGTFEPRHTHCTVSGLQSNTSYEFTLYMTDYQGRRSSGIKIQVETPTSDRTVLDVTQPPYSIDRTGMKIETAALQQAIDDCPTHGIVEIPAGAIVRSGALNLKSNMELRVNGELRGSDNPDDYLVADREHFKGHVNSDRLILTRYEGWELYCYQSLINIGYLNPNDRTSPTCENVTISGHGKIIGAGNPLGTAMKKIYNNPDQYPEYVSDGIPGRRVRGRLISIVQAKNVHVTGVTVEQPSCWTIHLIYADTVTIHGISINSQGIDNGDGIDPDSSFNIMIFDVQFDTGDDCIALKSGKNPEGNVINMPSKQIKIFDLDMLGGHGLAIGSEQSGGIEDVEIRNCRIQNTDFGIELKASRDRGGYIKNIRVADCQIDSFFAHEVNYNADGEGANQVPVFENIQMRNTSITGGRRNIDVMGNPIDSRGKAVELIGFSGDDSRYFINQVMFQDVELISADDLFYLNRCKNITLNRVQTRSGEANISTGPEVEKVVIN